MEMDGHESDLDGSVSNNDEELSDIHDEDSDDHLSRVQEDGNDADILSKLKQQVRNMERTEDHIQNQTPPTPHENPPGLSPFPHQFPLPLPFPFPHPAAAAFLPPVSGAHIPSYPAPPPHNSSGSSHSSESSNSSQQQTWSFEEQFKQVRQLFFNTNMKNSMRSTREEIKQKLIFLYSESIDSGRNVLDFDKKYDFFSMDESLVLKFSSNWFNPEKYSLHNPPVHSIKHYQSLGQDDCGPQKFCGTPLKQESLLRLEKHNTSCALPRDLEVLGKTPYQIGVDGEKFRVVAATLQKCNSPFIRRTFHFTSSGIVEAHEKKGESDSGHVLPILKQTKTVQPPKFVRIRRFRVIKKDDLPVEKYILPQKIKITNGEKTRFLTVRIRPKSSTAAEAVRNPALKLDVTKNDIQRILSTPEKKEPEINESNASSSAQTEETEDGNQNNLSDADTSSVSLDPTEEEMEEKLEEIRQMQEEQMKKEKGEPGETFKCENCGKQFLTYLSCLAHVRSHQRQVCQFCSKKFLNLKLLRDHIKIHHSHRIAKSGTSEDRIMTATSKFGRTRQVLNVAGLRTKYKML